jgi:Holliday junction resolvase RusA-like endonuclease
MSVYTIHETPVPLARPRFSRGIAYDSQKTEKLRDIISIKVQHESKQMFNDSVHLEVEFAFAFPKRFTKKQRESLKGKPCNNRCDLDNLIKYLADICIGIIYTDDKIITSISAKKIYCDHSYTKFMIRPL